MLVALQYFLLLYIVYELFSNNFYKNYSLLLCRPTIVKLRTFDFFLKNPR